VPDDPRVEQVLDELFDRLSTPEEACGSCPELLPEVRRRWRQMCRLEAEVDSLFPASLDPGGDPPSFRHDATILPHIPGYEVESLLGRGGMGVVFRARHLRLNRTVALKMLLAGPYAGPHERARFQREAEAVARLRHPNVVQIHDVGDADGRPYFTMEFVEGGSLAQRLSGTPQPARQAAALVATLAGAVQAAHQSGIAHRDLKPSNVLLTADGTPKVGDFGLARRLDGEAALTWTGTVAGTPSYMAPEQAAGKATVVGSAVDTYALGTILYELLTGRPPFRAETEAETLQQVISENPVPPSRLNASVPRDLDTICLKCLHKEPHLRYASTAALAEDLHRFLQGEAIAARPERWVGRLARRVRRRPLLSAAVAAGTLFTAALLGGGLWLMAERAAAARRVDAEKAAAAQRSEAEETATARAAEDDLREMAGRQEALFWPEARTALERAKGRLGDRGSPELRRRVEQGERDLALALRLDDIRLTSSIQVREPLAFTRIDGMYEEAFRGAGLGQPDDPPELVAARVQASPIRNALVAALDHWSEITRDPARKDWVLAVAQGADQDLTDWRVRARTPAIRRNPATVAELAAAAPVDQPVALLLALGKDMGPAVPPRLRFLRRVQQAHPGDLWVNLRLGDVLLESRKPGEAVGYFQAALAVRPAAAVVHNNLGVALGLTGRYPEALEQHQRAVQLEPATALFQYNLGVLLARLDHLDEALDPLRQAVALDPRYNEAQLSLRKVLIRLGRAEEARLAWKAALEADPPEHDAWYGYAEFCLYLGQEEEYRRARQALLARFGATTDPYVAERTGRACLLLPAEGDELCRAAALAERAAAVDREEYPDVYANFLFARGLADYRRGRFERAIATMRGEARRVLGPAPRLVLAMALHQNGQAEEARKALVAAVRSHDWSAEQVRDQDGWIYHVLRREAERLILPKNPPAFLPPAGEPHGRSP
jgi:serine/threonine-protein kinase